MRIDISKSNKTTNVKNNYFSAKNSLANLTSCIILLAILYTNCSLVTARNQKLKNKIPPSEINYDSNDSSCNHGVRNYNLSKQPDEVCNQIDFLVEYFHLQSCSGKEAREGKTTRFLLYDVNPAEGFNLKRDVYIRMAKLVKILNR